MGAFQSIPSYEPVLKQGYFGKRPIDGRMGRTMRRLFVLRESLLEWYVPGSRNVEGLAVGSVPRGSLRLTSAATMHSAGCSLVLRSDGHELELVFDHDAGVLNDWQQALGERILRLSRANLERAESQYSSFSTGAV